MFEERRRRFEEEEKAAQASSEAERKAERKQGSSVRNAVKPPTALPCERQGQGKWRVHKFYEDQAINVGLRCLDGQWGTEALHDFPKRPNGSALLLREQLLGSLLKGTRDLKSVPASDLSAAQGDLRHLSLRQLLKIRALHLDFVPPKNGGDTSTAFIEKMDWLLFEQLGKTASVNVTVDSQDSASACRLGRELTLLTAAAGTLPSPQYWVWWLGGCRRFFDAKLFTLSDAFPADGGVLQIEDKSAPDPNSKGLRRQIDWKVSLVLDESALAADHVVPSNSDLAAASFGANLNAPKITQDALTGTRAGLKKTGTSLR